MFLPFIAPYGWYRGTDEKLYVDLWRNHPSTCFATLVLPQDRQNPLFIIAPCEQKWLHIIAGIYTSLQQPEGHGTQNLPKVRKDQGVKTQQGSSTGDPICETLLFSLISKFRLSKRQEIIQRVTGPRLSISQKHNRRPHHHSSHWPRQYLSKLFIIVMKWVL